MSDDASPDQKLNIATYFLMSSPVGEVDEVLAGQCSSSHTRHTHMHRSAGTSRWCMLLVVCAAASAALCFRVCLTGHGREEGSIHCDCEFFLEVL